MSLARQYGKAAQASFNAALPPAAKVEKGRKPVSDRPPAPLPPVNPPWEGAETFTASSPPVQQRAQPPAPTPQASPPPPHLGPKTAIKLRLDPDIIEHFKSTGPGWQTRINNALRNIAFG